MPKMDKNGQIMPLFDLDFSNYAKIMPKCHYATNYAKSQNFAEIMPKWHNYATYGNTDLKE